MAFRRWMLAMPMGVALGVLSLGSLILCGCGGDDSEPYAELDKRFPEGRPGVADVETRMKDAAYVAQISDAASDISRLTAAAEKAKREVELHRETKRAALAKRLKAEPRDAVLADALAKDAHYQALLKAAAEAEAAIEAKKQANIAMIRQRIYADQTAYDALRAEADAKAKKAGLPTRTEQQVKAAAEQLEKDQAAKATDTKAATAAPAAPAAPSEVPPAASAAPQAGQPEAAPEK